MENNSSATQDLKSRQAVLQQLIEEKANFLENFPDQDEVKNILWCQRRFRQECPRLQKKALAYYLQMQTYTRFIDMLNQLIAPCDGVGSNPTPRQAHAFKKSLATVRKNSKEISAIVGLSVFPRTTNCLLWIGKFWETIKRNITASLSILKEKLEEARKQRDAILAEISDIEVKRGKLRQEYRQQKEVHEQQLIKLRKELDGIHHKLAEANKTTPVILRVDNPGAARKERRKSSWTEALGPKIAADRPPAFVAWRIFIVRNEDDQQVELPSDEENFVKEVEVWLAKDRLYGLNPGILYRKLGEVTRKNVHQRQKMNQIYGKKMFHGWKKMKVSKFYRVFLKFNEENRAVCFCPQAHDIYQQIRRS